MAMLPKPAQPVVAVSGNAYLVRMPNESTHLVGKDKRCNCGRGGRCPAVKAVARYLKAGGRRAPEPAAEPSALASTPAKMLRPPVCPICGEPTALPSPGLPPTAFSCPNGAHWFEWRAQEVLTRYRQTRPAWWPTWTGEERAAYLDERHQAMMDLYRGGRSVFS